MLFELDLYEWPSFMFARHGINGWFPKLAFDLMPFCDFREVSTTVDLVDVGTHSIDRDASESRVTPAPLTVEADGEGSHRYFPLAAWDYHMMIYGRRDIVSERKAIYQLWHSGQLAHVSPCEVTL